MSEKTCVATKGVFGPLCREPAAHATPIGYMCDRCANESMDALRSGETILNEVAKARGYDIEVLLSRFRPIQ